MKLSRDAWFLILLMVGFGVAAFFFTPKTDLRQGTSSFSTGKEGTKAFYMLLDNLGFPVSRQMKGVDEIPSDATVMIGVDPKKQFGYDGMVELDNWVRRGNTLILAVSDLPDAGVFDVDVDSHGEIALEPVTVAPRRGEFSAGASRVQLDPVVYFKPQRGDRAIIEDDKCRLIAVEHPLGRGRVIVFGDPLMFSNSRVGQEDNIVLLTNIVYERANGGRVMFAEWDRMAMTRDEEPAKPILGRAGTYVMILLLFVVLATLISAGRRFGEVHPLPETQEQRRSLEFVQAVAGLYRRSEAREAAVGAVYHSFRREMFARLGVAPDVGPAEAADMAQIAGNVDSTRLAAFLERCDVITAGEVKVSDGDAIAIVRAIEEYRRELGIAGSTDN